MLRTRAPSPSPPRTLRPKARLRRATVRGAQSRPRGSPEAAHTAPRSRQPAPRRTPAPAASLCDERSPLRPPLQQRAHGALPFASSPSGTPHNSFGRPRPGRAAYRRDTTRGPTMRQLRTPTRNPRRTGSIAPASVGHRIASTSVSSPPSSTCSPVSATRSASTRSACGVAGFCRSRVETRQVAALAPTRCPISRARTRRCRAGTDGTRLGAAQPGRGSSDHRTHQRRRTAQRPWGSRCSTQRRNHATIPWAGERAFGSRSTLVVGPVRGDARRGRALCCGHGGVCAGGVGTNRDGMHNATLLRRVSMLTQPARRGPGATPSTSKEP